MLRGRIDPNCPGHRLEGQWPPGPSLLQIFTAVRVPPCTGGSWYSFCYADTLHRASRSAWSGDHACLPLCSVWPGPVDVLSSVGMGKVADCHPPLSAGPRTQRCEAWASLGAPVMEPGTCGHMARGFQLRLHSPPLPAFRTQM